MENAVNKLSIVTPKMHKIQIVHRTNFHAASEIIAQNRSPIGHYDTYPNIIKINRMSCESENMGISFPPTTSSSSLGDVNVTRSHCKGVVAILSGKEARIHDLGGKLDAHARVYTAIDIDCERAGPVVW